MLEIVTRVKHKQLGNMFFDSIHSLHLTSKEVIEADALSKIKAAIDVLKLLSVTVNNLTDPQLKEISMSTFRHLTKTSNFFLPNFENPKKIKAQLQNTILQGSHYLNFLVKAFSFHGLSNVDERIVLKAQELPTIFRVVFHFCLAVEFLKENDEARQMHKVQYETLDELKDYFEEKLKPSMKINEAKFHEFLTEYDNSLAAARAAFH